MSSEVDRAYAAGFFDGEGCIRIGSRKVARAKSVLYRLTVQLTQNEREPLDWVQSVWGGYVRSRLQRPNGNIPHDWFAGGDIAASFLLDVRPFLRAKGPQADVAIAFQAMRYNPGGAGLPPHVTAQYRSMSETITRLKAAGQHPDFTDKNGSNE